MSHNPGTSSPSVPGLWLYPALLALHVTEEAALDFVGWAQRHASPRYTQRDFVQINSLGLASTVLASELVRRSDNRALFFTWYTAVLTQQALFNPVFHAGASVAFRDYSPGLLTSLAFPALWVRVTRLALRQRRLSRAALGAAIAAGGVIHSTAVGQQVFKLWGR
jgi:uncharacterized protein with HXXEE motif